MSTGSTYGSRRVIAANASGLTLLTGLVGVTAFCLGLIGFAWSCERAPGESSGQHILLTVYRTLTLFAPEVDYAEFATTPDGIETAFSENWSLQAARVLAPIATFGVVIRLLFELGGATLARLWLRYAASRLVSPLRRICEWIWGSTPNEDSTRVANWERWGPRGHVVVCGLGGIGRRLIRELRLEPELSPRTGPSERVFIWWCTWWRRWLCPRVVAIEANPTEDDVRLCSSLGVWIVVGDATNVGALRDAAVHRAGRVVVTLGTEVDRLECAAQVAQLAKDRKAHPLAIHVRVDKSSRTLQWRESPFFERGMPHSVTIPYSLIQYTARRVLREHPLCSWAEIRGQARVHVVLFGFTTMAEELVIAIGQTCYYPYLDRPRVTWIGCGAQEAERKFRSLYRFVDGAIDIAFAERDTTQGAIEAIETPDSGWPGADEPITAVLICEASQSESLSLAHDLRAASLQVRAWLTPILVYLPDAEGLRPYADVSETRFSERIHLFGAGPFDRFYEDVLEGEQDRLAKFLHRAYQRFAPSPVADRPFLYLPSITRLRANEKLSEDLLATTFQLASRCAADHVPVKLAAAGCAVGGDWSSFAADIPFPAAGKENWRLEPLAGLEHERWMAERSLDGWEFNPLRQNHRQKHNLLAEWDRVQLPPDEKEQKRQIDFYLVNNITAGLQQATPRRPLEPASPIPPVMTQPRLRVGIVGHCKLSQAQQDALRRQIVACLHQLVARCPQHHFVLLSALAPGADLVFAEAAADYLQDRRQWHGLTVVESLPLRVLRGIVDANPERAIAGVDGFLDEAHLRRVQEQESRAECIVELFPAGLDPTVALLGSRAATRRQRQWKRACAYVVERSDVLFVAYDEKRRPDSMSGMAIDWRRNLKEIPPHLSSWPNEKQREWQYNLTRDAAKPIGCDTICVDLTEPDDVEVQHRSYLGDVAP